MSVKPDVMVEALGAMTTVIDMGQLLEACHQDGIPLTNHQAREIEKISRECIDLKGFYTMNNKLFGKGTVFTFYTEEGLVTHNINLTLPEIDPTRKIPSRAIVQHWFEGLGYHAKRIEIDTMHKLIESHIRDGGSYDRFNNHRVLTFTLRMNGKVKSRYEFFPEDLSA